jgi:hypothetical protein
MGKVFGIKTNIWIFIWSILYLSGMDVHRRGKKWKPYGFMECVYELDKRLGR